MTGPGSGVRIGVDLGGTKIEAAAFDRYGHEMARQRVTTPRGDYAATLQAVRALVEQVEAGAGGQGTIGIGIPGAMSAANGLVKNANSTWLIGCPFDRDISELLGRPVRVANDANCFALSEATDGAGAEASVVFGVIIGTGTGGGIVVDRRIVEGRHRIAGEWGHNPLPWADDTERPGPACYCGRHGCIETFLSGPGLAASYLAATGKPFDAMEIVRCAGAGEPAAGAALDVYERRLARALASIINLLDPDVIVLGGGLSNISRLYENVPPIWKPFVFSDCADTPLVPARHGDSSGVRGAAWLWP